MDIVEFRLDRERLGGRGPFRVVNLSSTAADCKNWCARWNDRMRRPEGNAGLAGNYAGLAIGPELPASHYLGEPVETWFGDGDTVLLGCVCGDPGCWPLTARVTVSESTVTWSGFRTGHRDWDLSTVGPFTFERPAYEAALAKVYPR
jgi:hypothetical protein